MRRKLSLRLLLISAVAASSVVLVPASFAAKSGGGGGGTTTTNSLSLVMVNDMNGNGLPNWGDTVTFNVSTSAPYPAVQLACYQSGALVLNQTAGFFPSYVWSKDYPLQSSSWTSGAADCSATLYYTTKNGTNKTLATSSFHVDA